MTPKVLATESPVQAPAAQALAIRERAPVPDRTRRRAVAGSPESAVMAARPPDRSFKQPRMASAGIGAGCKVRRLGPDDVAAFQALRLEALTADPCVFAASPDEEVGQTLGEVAFRLERQPVFGAFAAGALLGVAGFAMPGPAKKRHKGLLWGVYVRERARGHGLGRALVAQVIEHARAHVVQLHAAVVTSNHAARGLYFSLGFERYGLEPRGLACAGRFFDQELLVLLLDGDGR